jgi:hypothetical protein
MAYQFVATVVPDDPFAGIAIELDSDILASIGSSDEISGAHQRYPPHFVDPTVEHQLRDIGINPIQGPVFGFGLPRVAPLIAGQRRIPVPA